jgi:GNAT superfamily N-acetyltransferase
MTSIRLAREDDIPCMVDMGMRFNEQSTYRAHLKVSRDRVALLGKQLIDAGGLLVSERNGQVVGMIGFVVFPHFMSGETVAGEVFWWVEPGHRGDGLRLLKEAERRARQAGAKSMQMIAPTEQVAKVYERMGFRYVESSYQRAL